MRNWKLWAKAAAVRAVKTMAQTAVATIGVAAVMQDVNWIAVGRAARSRVTNKKRTRQQIATGQGKNIRV